jgi:hypothetical protein
MAIAQGQCPSCGAPMTFGVGASVSQVCRFCRHVVVRTDRDLRNMGKIADLALTPSPIAVGDEGALEGRHLTVMGRVQLDHGAGPWDEWYVAFHDGAWGWLAYAQGNWYVTQEVPTPGGMPPWDHVAVEQDLSLGTAGTFRVMERKRGTIVSGEGELPFEVKPGTERYYVDLSGANFTFGTLDYGDRSGALTLFLGKQFMEGALSVKPMAERAVQEIGVEALTCPNCGGNLPALVPKRAERLACPYCGAVSEIASRRVIQQQAAAYATPDSPLGSRGTLNGQEYVVCGYVERSTDYEGETFRWQEYLLYGPGLGFRWLVKDESAWMWITPLSIADIDLRGMPRSAGFQGRTFRQRNDNRARVDYVLGELYWKVQAGEIVDAMDFVSGADVLSRERTGDEVAWSFGTPVAWALIAQTFNLPLDGAGARFAPPQASYDATDYGGGGGGGGATSSSAVMMVVLGIVGVMLLLGVCAACGGCDDDDDGYGSTYGGGVYGTTGGTRGGK